MGHIPGANSSNLDLKKRINELEAEVEELKYKYLPNAIYVADNTTTQITLDVNSTYLVVIKNFYNVGVVCIVQTGGNSSSCLITELVKNDYFKFIAAGTRTLDVQSGGATGVLYAIKLTDLN